MLFENLIEVDRVGVAYVRRDLINLRVAVYEQLFRLLQPLLRQVFLNALTLLLSKYSAEIGGGDFYEPGDLIQREILRIVLTWSIHAVISRK